MKARSIKNVSGKLVDVHSRSIYAVKIQIANGRISAINKIDEDDNLKFILPGFVDAHIHIESSMLTPYEFAKEALPHGTVATVSDPHEIANVNGIEGVEYMIKNAKDAMLKFNFGAPSCVPATSFECAGAVLNADDVAQLLKRKEIKYLSEMMNYPGVLFNDPEVMAKINAAKSLGKPVDGHAPGLMGEDAIKYIDAGISTDHECFTLAEALHKVKNGMKIIIREGSAAKNFEALHPLFKEHADMLMFCSDDKHPDELVHGHINLLVKRAITLGYDLFDVLRAACLQPVIHYNLDVGLLRVGDPADMIVVDDLENLSVLQTIINSTVIAENGTCYLPDKAHTMINNFSCDKKNQSDFMIEIAATTIPVIEALDGQLITERIDMKIKKENGFAISDAKNDILKIVVVNRYKNEKPAVAFIKNFGLKEGAIAGSVAHDSHNIIAVGVDDEMICKAVNLIIENKGGLSAVNKTLEKVLPLPIAGLISDRSGKEIAKKYSEIDAMAKSMGSKLSAPYMTLSFMALLVIPKIKLSDKGLFDAQKFEFLKYD